LRMRKERELKCVTVIGHMETEGLIKGRRHHT